MCEDKANICSFELDIKEGPRVKIDHFLILGSFARFGPVIIAPMSRGNDELVDLPNEFRRFGFIQFDSTLQRANFGFLLASL